MADLDLFGNEVPLPRSAGRPVARPRKVKPDKAVVEAAPPSQAQLALAATLSDSVRLGTSSWHFPGWDGLVYAGDYPDSVLSKHGLQAYVQNPLLKAVSLDRSFYRPLTAAQYRYYAEQIAPYPQAVDFRFIVKAPASVCDASVRDDSGRATQANPLFLNPEFAWKEALEPACNGLRHNLGALVFQISPLPHFLVKNPQPSLDALHLMLSFLESKRAEWQAVAPNAVIAVEVRDSFWVAGDAAGPAFAQILKSNAASYCVGVHAKMPSVEGQLPMLRALWPGPLVVRWNLHSKHGSFGYAAARQSYEPFDQLVDPDLVTREVLAKVIAATARVGQPVLVSINNKAEGCAPKSVEALALAIQHKNAANAGHMPT